MKIYIDIVHPATFHFYRNFIRIMEQEGHEFFISAKDKEVTLELLNHYGLDYYNRGKAAKTPIGKILNIIKSDVILLQKVKRFAPDLIISFSSPIAAHIAFLMRKPCIAYEDTECSGLVHNSYLPFSSLVITPSCFTKNFGEKQISISSYKELGYLKSKYFCPNKNIYELLGIETNEKYSIVRFVSHHAIHDKGVSWLSEEDKINLVNALSPFSRVFISSEESLSSSLEGYRLKTKSWELHSVLANASLLIGESATMSSESAMLGIPSIFIDSQGRGYTNELEKMYGLVFNFKPTSLGLNNAINKAVDILKSENLLNDFQERKEKMLSAKIDITSFMVWFVENYPESIETMHSKPDYQYNFK